MVQAFYMDRCHFCPSPESSRVICQSIQRKVKDFFSFFTCSMSVKVKEGNVADKATCRQQIEAFDGLEREEPFFEILEDIHRSNSVWLRKIT
jgi:hypothetical protein